MSNRPGFSPAAEGKRLLAYLNEQEHLYRERSVDMTATDLLQCLVDHRVADALLEIIRGAKAQIATRRVCANCGAEFFSNAWQASYCSVKCRNTSQKRRYRHRKQGLVR